jgi:hypothetical protein
MFALVLGMLLSIVSTVRGDEVRLKNGAVIHGRVVMDGKDAVVVEVGHGRMNLARRDVISVTIAREPVQAPAERPASAEVPARRASVRETARHHPTTTMPPPPAGRRAAPAARVIPVERVVPATAGPELETAVKKARSVVADVKARSRPVASKPAVKPDW